MIRMRVQELAQQRGMNLETVSQISGVDESILKDIYHNPTTIVDKATMQKLTAAFNIGEADLIKDVLSESVSPPLYSYAYGANVASEKGYAHFRKQLRLKKFLPFINPKPTEKILELGCNDGAFARHVSTYGADVLGIDINQEMITSLHDEHFMVMSATNLTFPDHTFDKIYSFEVIEHIPEIQKCLSEAHRVLKQNGLLILSFPWELIRGQAAIGNSLQIYHNLHYSRRLHMHKLSPKKIKEITQAIPFIVRTSTICAIPFPSYVMVLEKKGK